MEAGRLPGEPKEDGRSSAGCASNSRSGAGNHGSGFDRMAKSMKYDRAQRQAERQAERRVARPSARSNSRTAGSLLSATRSLDAAATSRGVLAAHGRQRAARTAIQPAADPTCRETGARADLPAGDGPAGADLLSRPAHLARAPAAASTLDVWRTPSSRPFNTRTVVIRLARECMLGQTAMLPLSGAHLAACGSARLSAPSLPLDDRDRHEGLVPARRLPLCPRPPIGHHARLRSLALARQVSVQARRPPSRDPHALSARAALEQRGV